MRTTDDQLLLPADFRPPTTMTTLRRTVICLALLLEGMSSSSINVQIGQMRLDLHMADATLQLAVGAFLVAYAGLLPVAGRLVDARDRRSVFLTGVSLFGVGCLVCAAAITPWMLVTGRFVQGAGAALSAPAALALITAGLPEGKVRGRAVALYGAMGAAGFSLGLVVPGYIVAEWGWRASMFALLPVVLVVLATTWGVQTPPKLHSQRIDLVGAVVLTVALVLVMHLIGGIGTLPTLALVTETALIGVLCLVLLDRRGGDGFPREVLRSPAIVSSCVAIAAVFAAVVSSMFVLSLWLQARHGADAFEVGLAILPQPVCFALLSASGARLVAARGATPVLATGMALITMSLVHLGLVGEHWSSAAAVLPSMAGVGAGLALCFPAASIAVVDAAPERFRGTAAGLLTTAQNLGGAACLAAVTALAIVPSAENGIGLRAGMLVAASVLVFGAVVAGGVALRGRQVKQGASA